MKRNNTIAILYNVGCANIKGKIIPINISIPNEINSIDLNDIQSNKLVHIILPNAPKVTPIVPANDNIWSSLM